MLENHLRRLRIRAETKPGERRAPLTPTAVARMRAERIPVEVERARDRAFTNAEYLAAGATLVPAGSWRACGSETLVLGLKELPESSEPLSQTHGYFAHCFKGQPEASALLARFAEGRGSLFDLEFLTDPTGRRVAAFGQWAGFVGAAVGVLAWADRSESPETPPLKNGLTPWRNADELVAFARRALGGRSPRVGVTGHLGRAGRGASDFLSRVGLRSRGWDRGNGGAEPNARELTALDVLVHCVGLTSPQPPFLERADLARPNRTLSILVDVTCDQSGPLHLFPFYRAGTTLENPVRRIAGTPPLHVIAIDHLPTLLPRESSEEFSSSLLPEILRYFSETKREPDAWSRAADSFRRALECGIRP